MPVKELGPLRRSGVASTFGPGAVIDFRSGDATVSAVAAGLEEWDRNFGPPGILNLQSVHEPRLQKKLGVKGFRLPPVRIETRGENLQALVAVRFPEWLQCPSCNRIAESKYWAEDPGRPGLSCGNCSGRGGRRKVHVIPVRFVMACEAGHLDEFPWHTWVAHKGACTNRGFLVLRSERAGLAGLVVSCPKCAAKRSMDGIFSKATWERFPVCKGRRPWLAAGNETCDKHARAVQRGASNLYFPVSESALSIPPWSDRLQDSIGSYWDLLINAEDNSRGMLIRLMEQELEPVMRELGLNSEQLAEELRRRASGYAQIETDDLRLEEYQQFQSGTSVSGLDNEFEIRPQPVPAAISKWIGRIVKVVRLREVRALKGFTRIQPPGDADAPNICPLSEKKLSWLPAVEVRGEGLFIELAGSTLEQWEQQPLVQERIATINQRWKQEWRARYDEEAPREITPRLVLVHTFAHALMRQLTLDCGYSSTALRERLYVSDESAGMAGLLIYTATTDDDGTLGGLQRQASPHLIERNIVSAIQAQTWCSSDPLCIEDMMVNDDAMSLAACHACALTPETSCEEFNRFLDRALLVGTPTISALGFFNGIADALSA